MDEAVMNKLMTELKSAAASLGVSVWDLRQWIDSRLLPEITEQELAKRAAAERLERTRARVARLERELEQLKLNEAAMSELAEGK